MKKKKKNSFDEDLPGNYDASEDIYRQNLVEKEVDPEDTSRRKEQNTTAEGWNSKDFADDVSGSDLDVPGAELDDEWENVGAEDEENNYYSLGGDNHNDLEENPGD